MIWDVCFYLSITLLVICVLIALLEYFKITNIFNSIHAFTLIYLGVFLAVLVIIYPLITEDGFTIENFTIPVLNSFQVFTGDSEFNYEALTAVESTNTGVISRTVYSGYMSLLYLIAPVLTISFILQFFSNWLNRVRFRLLLFKRTFLFSSLNERTLITAKDIMEHSSERKPLIVFLDPTEDDENNEYFKDEARSIGALVIQTDIRSFRIGYRFNEMLVLLTNEDEVQNVTDMMDLVENKSFRNCSKNYVDRIYVFTSVEEYQSIINSFVIDHSEELKNIRIITVDEIHNIVNRLFQDHPLFSGLINKQPIKLVTIGNTRLAKEVVRTASWIGQMLTHPISIEFISEDGKAIEREMDFLYPELYKNCEIKYLTRTDLKLSEYIRKSHPTYIVLAEEDEIENLRIGIELATIFKQDELISGHHAPQIHIWNQRVGLKKQLKVLKDSKNNEYHLIPFGDFYEQYSQDNIFNSRIDQLGEAVHHFYDKSDNYLDNYFRSEYNRKSSAASALHNIYRLEDLRQLDGRDPNEEFTRDSINQLIKDYEVQLVHLEHDRWAAYQRAIGFRKLDLPTLRKLIAIGKLKEHMSFPLKIHACLVDWDTDVGNPLRDAGVTYENISPEEIQEWLEGKHGKIDDLDRVTLTCWQILNEDKYNHLETKRLGVNFKDLDKDILQILPEVFES